MAEAHNLLFTRNYKNEQFDGFAAVVEQFLDDTVAAMDAQKVACPLLNPAPASNYSLTHPLTETKGRHRLLCCCRPCLQERGETH